ncbi:hypothetical protein FRC09_018609 [Ceratobasidium sp. 395]|nr:hypothetical protein FRC09_018609 [Ceratobasidium sp. 395]
MNSLWDSIPSSSPCPSKSSTPSLSMTPALIFSTPNSHPGRDSSPTAATPLTGMALSKGIKRRAHFDERLANKKQVLGGVIGLGHAKSGSSVTIPSLAMSPLRSPIQLRKVPITRSPVQTSSFHGWRVTSQMVSLSSPPSSPVSSKHQDSETDVDVVGNSDIDSDVDVVGISESDSELDGSGYTSSRSVAHSTAVGNQQSNSRTMAGHTVDEYSDEYVDVVGLSDESMSGPSTSTEDQGTNQCRSSSGYNRELSSSHFNTYDQDSESLLDVLDLISDSDEDITDALSRPLHQYAPALEFEKELDVIDLTSSGDESAGLTETKRASTTIHDHPADTSRIQLSVLQLCLETWGIGRDWSASTDANPIWDVLNSPLMAEHTMDYVSAYLVHSKAQTQHHGFRGHCLVPASLSGALLQTENICQGVENWITKTGPNAMTQLLLQRHMVWSSSEPPQVVLLPIIDHLQAHCYLWFGKVCRQPSSGIFNLDLHLLDSLSPPSSETVAARLASCTSILRFLLPQINGEISGQHMAIPGYRQAPGTTDCGYFVCQAISAIVYSHRSSLWHLSPVSHVKQRVLSILQLCQSGSLDQLVRGNPISSPIILHLPPQVASPPWLSKSEVTLELKNRSKPVVWVPPVVQRSLSEPPGDADRYVGRGSWEEVFGPRVDVQFEQVSGEAFRGYLEAVAKGKYSPPSGLLANSGGQMPQSLMRGLLLEGEAETLSWVPDAPLSGCSDEEGLLNLDGGAGLRRFLQGLSHLRDGRERSLAILTGEHRNQHLHLNWSKETVDIEEEWLTAGLDVDSLSLTAEQPQFTSGVVLYAYPPRSGTLTTDNGLSVYVDNKAKKLSHSESGFFYHQNKYLRHMLFLLVPNLTFGHVGSHNQFRINVFFPRYQKGQNNAKQYITMMNEQDFTQWYDEVVWQAICRVELLCPEQYRHAATGLRQLLPRSYQNAKLHATQGGFEAKGYKILPELFNLVLQYARQIIDRSARLYKFRGFFLHIWGTNLKAVGHEVFRSDGNALLHVLKSFPIVDWSLQNPRDIAVDIGLEINLRHERLPTDVDGLTLLWKLGPLKALARHGWRKTHVDAYMHSHVVGGVSAAPRSALSFQLYYVHAYMKDKVLTYRHRDSSIGTGFSAEDALLNTQRYVREMETLHQVLKSSPGSFGVRIEWRCGVWAANQILSLGPDVWVQRFQQAEAIIAHRTSDIVKLKLAMVDSYRWFFTRLQELQATQRWTEPVILMSSVLTYLTQGLVKRPDEMSPSRFMFKNLGIMHRVRRFGFASVPKDRLSDDCLGMASALSFEEFTILKYAARKNPAGARIKTSRLAVIPGAPAEDRSAQTTVRHPRPLSSVAGDADFTWVLPLVNQTLATWIWGRLNEGDKRREAVASHYHGPLVLSRWRRCVDIGVQYEVRPSTTGFQKAQAAFTPPNWVLLGRGKVWQTLQTIFLNNVLDHISSISEEHQPAYSQRVRSAINAALQTWEFLPCLQKDKVWSYAGTGRTKSYKVYRNPSFSCQS